MRQIHANDYNFGKFRLNRHNRRYNCIGKNTVLSNNINIVHLYFVFRGHTHTLDLSENNCKEIILCIVPSSNTHILIHIFSITFSIRTKYFLNIPGRIYYNGFKPTYHMG